jgi:pSer/pThr/pTyr-binding forkhead associated (FHA) protein
MSGVSEHHCSLRRIGGELFVEDHSREGCYVNDVRVDELANVRPGDRLRLGTSGVELQLIEVVA